MTDLPHTDFHDERIDMAYWLPKLRGIKVPVPESQPLPIDRTGDKPTWDSDFAAEVVENLGGKAFARSGYKSAQMALQEGSEIYEPSADHVDRTLMELVSQHLMMEMPLGESLWLREYLDLNWNHFARQPLVPEVRVFVRDGAVVCHHPRLEGFRGREKDQEVAEQLIESAWSSDRGKRSKHEGIETYAQRVADEFDGWWSVDFVIDVNGDVWCTDMALDALYERDGELRGISSHPDDCEHDIEVQYND